MTRENIVLQLAQGVSITKEGQEYFKIDGWISIDKKGNVNGQLCCAPLGATNQKSARYLTTVTGNFATNSESKYHYTPSGKLALKVSNERFGVLHLEGQLSVGKQSLELSQLKNVTDCRSDALRAIVASIMNDSIATDTNCQGAMMSQCTLWRFSRVDFDGPRFYRSVFESVNESKLPGSLVSLVSSYLIPGFRMPSKLSTATLPDFTPADLPVTLKLSCGKSTHLPSGQIFWQMFGELRIKTDLSVEGFVNHRKPSVPAEDYLHQITFRNELKGYWNRTMGQLLIHANCAAFGEQHLVGNFHMGDLSAEFALLQNLTEGTDWKWEFAKVAYDRNEPKIIENRY